MESQDTGLKAVIKNASTLVQETASKSEAAALEAVERVEATFADAQTKWNDARDVRQRGCRDPRPCRPHLLQRRHRVQRRARPLRQGRRDRHHRVRPPEPQGASSLKDIVDLNVAFMTRRSQAMFASVNELNAIAQAKTVAAWSPLGETLRKAGEKSSVQASA